MIRTKNINSHILCSGSNISGLINKCVSAGIELKNVKRMDTKSIEFDLNDTGLKIFNKLDLKLYNITIQNKGGLELFKRTIKYRCGLIIGIVFSLCMGNKDKQKDFY